MFECGVMDTQKQISEASHATCKQAGENKCNISPTRWRNYGLPWRDHSAFGAFETFKTNCDSPKQ
jgi:hypothetical protein